jgi:hypothetical protein
VYPTQKEIQLRVFTNANAIPHLQEKTISTSFDTASVCLQYVMIVSFVKIDCHFSSDSIRIIQSKKDYVSFRTGQTCQTSLIGLQSVVFFSWYDSALTVVGLGPIGTAVTILPRCG